MFRKDTLICPEADKLFAKAQKMGKKRGRPLGSKNKPKAEQSATCLFCNKPATKRVNPIDLFYCGISDEELKILGFEYKYYIFQTLTEHNGDFCDNCANMLNKFIQTYNKKQEVKERKMKLKILKKVRGK